jgi:xylan 1,4-beta-xylosidase
MGKTFVNPLCLPDYPVSKQLGRSQGFPRAANVPEIPENSPFGMGPMIAAGLPPTHARFNKLFGARSMLQVENDTRSSADPVALYYNETWYLYASGSACWSSKDFTTWTSHDIGQCFHMAPGIAIYNGRFYLAGNSTDLFVSDSPTGPFTSLGDFTWQGKPLTPRHDDVSFFVDEDNRFYFFWGMGPGIWGAELDGDNPTVLKTEPKNLIQFDANHWYERCGQNNQDWSNGFPEGASMIKVNGVYYLMFSTCGTEYDTYAMVCYKSSVSPLEGFERQKFNPMARKVHGMVRGIGHASVTRGPNDTLWLFETVLIGVDGDLERRLACDPAGIDENGDLYVKNYYEVPQFVPGVMSRPELANGTDLDNITSRHSIWSTSHAPGRNAVYGNDNNIMTWWQPADDDKEPMLVIGLRADYYVYGARVMFKEVGMDYSKGIEKGLFRYKIELLNGNPNTDEWVTVVDRSANDEDFVFFYDTLDKPILAQYSRLVITGWPEGQHPGIIDFSLFGMHTLKPYSGETVRLASVFNDVTD